MFPVGAIERPHVKLVDDEVVERRRVRQVQFLPWIVVWRRGRCRLVPATCFRVRARKGRVLGRRFPDP